MKPGQRTLLLLVALTAAPFVLAQIAFEFYRGEPPQETTNKGTLVQPAVDLSALQLQEMPGPTLQDRKWRLLLYRPAVCNEQCQRELARVRAIPTLLGREGGRVRVALIVDDAANGNPGDLQAGLPRLQAKGRIGAYRDGLFLVDPQGNVVLWYDRARIGAEVLSDLRFLLKNSSIG